MGSRTYRWVLLWWENWRRNRVLLYRRGSLFFMSGEFKKLFPLERLEQMVNAHAMEFGCEPLSIQIPTPDFVFRGIQVHFINLPQYYTIDKSNCLHHHFTKGDKQNG